jgi:F-type H+-transporting ATPase subunit b
MQQETLWSNPRTWVGVAFILFFVIFGRRLWAVISKLLDDHTAAVRAELEEASRLRREAETMLRDAKARRVAALAEAKALIEGAKAQAERVSAATAAEAAESASRRERMAMDRIAAAEKAAVDEVRQTAAVAARRLLAEGLTAEADAGLIDHAIAGLPQALRAA